MKQLIKKLSNFIDDDILYYAGSLSFFTILALLPILALVIVLISSLNIFTQYINQFTLFILDFINPTHSEKLLSTITSFLSNASELSTLGFSYLLFSFILFFRDYDHIINKIYNIKEKNFISMFSTYILFIIFIPILFILSLVVFPSLNIKFFQYEIINSILIFIIYWSFFIILFKISINQTISNKAIFISTLFVLITLSIFKYIFIFYTIYNHMYTTIYGSFSVLMFFFVWLYVSWLIYLYGIKLSNILNQKLSNN